jgi:5-methylcytosine-specific restriction endonuclease McrA
MTPAKTCQKCGTSFVQNYTRGRPRLYCSRKCRLALQTMKRRKPQDHEKCLTCYETLTVVKSNQKFCSQRCREVAAIRRARIRRNQGFDGSRACADCEKLFEIDRPRSMRKYCSECRRRRKQDTDARKSQRRRAAGHPVSLSEVVAARGQRCHICQRKINLNLSGRDLMGPTIDHILPVSMGGTNDLANLNIAHRVCNMRRGNRGPAQMILEDFDAWTTAEAS